MGKRLLICVAIVLLMIGCTRRPIREDVQRPDGPPTHQANSSQEIESSPGAADSPYEKRFIDTIIELQLNAIDAEHMVSTRSEHTELKQFAFSLMADQQQQIAALRDIRRSLFGDGAKAVDLDLSGAREALRAINVEKLDALKENSFDLEFIGQMTAYFGAFNKIAAEALSKNPPVELKEMAERMTNANTRHIEQLNKLGNEWKKR